jgi:hypothetical protein
VRQVYNELGYPYQVRNPLTDALYWEAQQQDAQGNLMQFFYGNGLTTQRLYNANNNYLEIVRGHSMLAGIGNYDIQDEEYRFDTLGNLTRRYNYLEGAAEAFSYDPLNRLIRADRHDGITLTDDISPANLAESKSYAYDAIGNLTYKSDVSASDYLYGVGNLAGDPYDAGPHAVTGIGTHAFTYDDNGNMTQGHNFTSGQNRTLTWILRVRVTIRDKYGKHDRC